ncbi:unnamed protein product, partial [Symbiodinium microadriaticum]
ADEEQKRQEDKRQAELRHKKALAEQFKADRAVYVEAERVREERRAQEEAEARRRHIDANKGHVQQREAMRLQKLEENRRKEVSDGGRLLTLLILCLHYNIIGCGRTVGMHYGRRPCWKKRLAELTC